MRILVVFYSRTGKTKVVAKKLAEITKSDVEEIMDTKNRSGFIGVLLSGYEAARRKLTVIMETKYDPSQYDLVIIGTPVWAGVMSVPVRTYISNHKGKFNNVAFFCTHGMKDAPKIFKDLGEACQKEPVATLKIRSTEIEKGEYLQKINGFVSMLGAQG
ncbi:MAG: flavodoxin family protein [Candidatus Methanomethylicaceae archaeon]